MANSVGFGAPIPYGEPVLATTMTKKVTLKHATRIIPLTERTFRGNRIVNIADGTTVTATRLDAEGSATGEAANDEVNGVWAVFDEALAIGHWTLVAADE